MEGSKIETLLADTSKREDLNKEVDKMLSKVREAAGDRDKQLNLLAQATGVVVGKLKANLELVAQELEKDNDLQKAKITTDMAMDILKEDITKIIKRII